MWGVGVDCHMCDSERVRDVLRRLLGSILGHRGRRGTADCFDITSRSRNGQLPRTSNTKVTPPAGADHMLAPASRIIFMCSMHRSLHHVDQACGHPATNSGLADQIDRRHLQGKGVY